MSTQNLTVSWEWFTSDIPNLKPNLKWLSSKEAGEICRKITELIRKEGKEVFPDMEKPFLDSIKPLLEMGTINEEMLQKAILKIGQEYLDWNLDRIKQLSDYFKNEMDSLLSFAESPVQWWIN